MERDGGGSQTAVATDRNESGRIDSIGQFIQELTSGIADAADADQWAVVVPGVDDTGPTALQDLIPAAWLDALDGGRAATHRLALPLRSGRRHLGVVRLECWKPGGFREGEVHDARRAVRSAARLLDMLIPEANNRTARPTRVSPALQFV